MNVEHFVQNTTKDVGNILGTLRKVVVSGLAELCCILFGLKLNSVFYIKELIFIKIADFLLEYRVLKHKDVGLKNLPLCFVAVAGFGKRIQMFRKAQSYCLNSSFKTGPATINLIDINVMLRDCAFYRVWNYKCCSNSGSVGRRDSEKYLHKFEL